MNVTARGLRPFVALIMVAAPALGVRAEEGASVNGTTISAAEVEKAFQRTSVAKKELSSEEASLYRRHVLNMLIDELLVARYLDDQEVVIDEKKVDQHIAQLTKQLEAKKETLASFLAKVGVSEAKMREDISGMYRWMAFVDKQATPDTLAKYFDANRAAFDGSTVRASHILVRVAPDADEKARAIARRKIELVRAQLASGTPFSSAARAHSDCPSKDEGGDLEYFPRKGAMTESFAAVAFSLPVGQVSDVVESEFGYHLILVTDRKPGAPVNYADVAEDVKSQYASDLRAATVARLRADSDIKFLR